jgi:hypothetical protein
MKYKNGLAFIFGFLGWFIFIFVYYGILFYILPHDGPEGLLLIFSVCFFIPINLTVIGLLILFKFYRQASAGVLAAAIMN